MPEAVKATILAAYAARPTPRYTSYPTAPHFSPDLDETLYRSWLERIDPGEPISLYLHVPFCKRMCWYCGCNMKLAARYAPVAAYVASLRAEIALLRAALPGRPRVAHLHWGGGTPTALEPDDLEAVMADLAIAFEFTPDVEIAIEADPRTLTAAMIERVGRLGFTRASFGVQEFDATVQAASNREQPPAMVAEACVGLREAGVRAINFDLIYGLPHQTAEALSATVETCQGMAPDRVALFGYAHVPWMAPNQRMIPEDALPDGAERARQAATAARALGEAGYESVGLDHFALPADPLALAAREGRLRRNFQGYTTDAAETLLGLGATAIGRTPFGHVQNIAETGAWARAVGEGRLPVARGHAFAGEDRLRAHVIERLMCDGAVDTDAAGRHFAHGPDWCAGERERMREMAGHGLVELDGATIRLTPTGRPLARVVAAVFDLYLASSSARHSRAV